MGDLPSLLVATEFPPNASGGGPAIVRQMLKDWPAEDLFWWSCLPDSDKKFGRAVAGHFIAAIPSRLYPHRRFRKLKSLVLEHSWTSWATRHLHKTLLDTKPDVIWVIPHSWSIPPLGRVLRGAETGFHVSMHDYADSNNYVSLFGKERVHQFAATADELYLRARTRDAISESMVADLLRRTKRTGAVLHAGLDQSEFDYLEKKPEESTTGPIRIAYAGTILVEETFVLFVDVLQRIRHQISTPITLELFGAHSYKEREWFDPSWMIEHGLLSEAELSDSLRSFTWGFAPMSLTDDDPRYNRFSLPTKFVSYLAAGLPIITIGCGESTVVKLTQKYAIGPSSTSRDPEVLRKTLSDALSTKRPWACFKADILRCSRAEFDARKMRETLFENLGLGCDRPIRT